MSSLDTMLLDIAAKHAALADSVPADIGRQPLSRRQRQIAALVADGFTPREIGEELAIDMSTVGVHLHRIRRKCGVATTSELPAVIADARMFHRDYPPIEPWTPPAVPPGRKAPSMRAHQLLTRRQEEIALLIGDGYSNKEIAGQLWISLETVKRHVHHALVALNARNRTHLAVLVREVGDDA